MSKDILAKFTKAMKLFEMGHNSRNYRQRLDETTSACVPYVALFSKDLNSLHEAQPLTLVSPSKSSWLVRYRGYDRLERSRPALVRLFGACGVVLRPATWLLGLTSGLLLLSLTPQEGEVINFDKLRSSFTVLLHISQLQKRSYSLEPQLGPQAYLNGCLEHALSDAEVYRLSLQILPKS